MGSNLGIQNTVQSNRVMLCPCCGGEITLGVRECGCGARFVGSPLHESPVKVKRFGPVMTAVVLLAVAASLTLVITKWLVITGVIVIRYAIRAMRLTRRDPEGYGGYLVAAATLAIAIAGGPLWPPTPPRTCRNF